MKKDTLKARAQSAKSAAAISDMVGPAACRIVLPPFRTNRVSNAWNAWMSRDAW